MSTFSDARLLDYGPHEFRRAVQRLMQQNGFEAFSVDGPGDQGADLFCERGGERWVVQCKWKKSGRVDRSAIEEALNAMSAYDAHTSIVATNASFTKNAWAYLEQLNHSSVNIDLWGGDDLRTFAQQADNAKNTIELRDYQGEAISSITSDLISTRRSLLYLATGMGKTVVAGRVIREYLDHDLNAKILVLAHMNELLEQLQRAMWRDVPLHISTQLVNATNKPNELPGVTVASNLSIEEYVDAGYRPDLLVIDECHHVGEANTYAKLISKLDGIPILGVTATPWRGDRFSIEQTFGPPSYSCSIEDGMKRGYLSPVDYRLFCDNIDWDEVPQMSQNAYTIRDLNKKLFIPTRDEKIIDSLSEVWLEVSRPKCIVFCQSIAHATSLADQLRTFDRWRDAQVLHSEMSANDRKFALLNFRADRCSVLVAVDILNEGVDVPDVNIVCFARVTHSRKIFVQQLGRGLRLADHKDKVIVLDFAADLRRLAALSTLNANLAEDKEIEKLSMEASQVSFTDTRAKQLVDEWIKDAASLETASQEAQLQFPDF